MWSDSCRPAKTQAERVSVTFSSFTPSGRSNSALYTVTTSVHTAPCPTTNSTGAGLAPDARLLGGSSSCQSSRVDSRSKRSLPSVPSLLGHRWPATAVGEYVKHRTFGSDASGSPKYVSRKPPGPRQLDNSSDGPSIGSSELPSGSFPSTSLLYLRRPVHTCLCSSV